MTNESILEVKHLTVNDTVNPGSCLKDVSFSVRKNRVVGVIGAPASGNSLLLRAFNRLNELSPNIHTSGEILLQGENIAQLPAGELRRRIGMIFRTPKLFPHWDIYSNVLAGYKLCSIRLSQAEANRIVEESLREVYLWDDLHNSLQCKPYVLTAGQQQCLCIARSLALVPEVLLMEEPAYALDAIYTEKIRDIISRLSNKMTLIISTHHPSRMTKVADEVLFLEAGELVEYNTTSQIFLTPSDPRTELFITTQI
ncbi:phosphate import ATP-binding protein PstB [Bacteroidia bacterium]|nr:phosphate import ATP-binding protein PstB [Bacteroidia bacterium]